MWEVSLTLTHFENISVVSSSPASARAATPAPSFITPHRPSVLWCLAELDPVSLHLPHA